MSFFAISDFRDGKPLLAPDLSTLKHQGEKIKLNKDPHTASYSSQGTSYNLQHLYCINITLQCSQMFPNSVLGLQVALCSRSFVDIQLLRNLEAWEIPVALAPGVPRCSQVFSGAPSCSQVFPNRGGDVVCCRGVIALATPSCGTNGYSTVSRGNS